jgi:hypothetical protein
MSAQAPKAHCWFQLDREGDAWPILTTAGAGGHWFTIRANWDRRVEVENDGRTYLRTVLGVLPVVMTYPLEVRGGPNRTARRADLVVRAASVTLDLRDKRTGKRLPMKVNAVQVLEQGTTPTGEKPIEWMLFTNRPVETSEHLKQIIFGYSLRWRIEEFHRTWKSACRVEETQLRSSAAVIKWATILTAVAVRTDRLKQLSREEPQTPASDEFTPLELRAIVLLRFGEKTRPPSTAAPTIAEATLWVAQIGGYTGKRPSTLPPGSVTIARGLSQVKTAVKTLKALEARGPRL